MRYYVYSDDEPEKTARVIDVLKKLPENSLAQAYFVSDGDIPDTAKLAKYCLKKENVGIPIQDVLSVVPYVEAKALIARFLSGMVKKRQYLVFSHVWTKRFPDIVAEPSKDSIERFLKLYAIPEHFFSALEGLPVVIEHAYDATYVRLRERYDMRFKELSLAWGKTHRAFSIPMDPFIPYEIDRALRDRMVRGSDITFGPKETFDLLNSQRIKKSSLVHHFFNKFGMDRNAKAKYIAISPFAWKKHIYRKSGVDYSYGKTDRKLETLHRFHDTMFYDIPLLITIRLHFSGNGAKTKAQLAKYAKYVRTEYVRKAGLPKMVDEAVGKNIDGILSKIEELYHAADHMRKEFSMDADKAAEYLKSDSFAKKVGLNVSSGGDPGDAARTKAFTFLINEGFLKTAREYADSLSKS